MCRLISGTGRTSVDAVSILGCRLSTTDRVEKFRNAGDIANNLGCSTIENRCCASHYRLSVNGNAIERRLPITLLTKGVSALAKKQCVRATTDLNGQRNPGKVAGIKCAVCASDEEFRTRCSELGSKHLRGHHALRDESLEQWGCVIDRYGLESHAHQAIWREDVAHQVRRILGCSTQGLRFCLCGTSASRNVKKSGFSYSQVDDADSIGKLFAVDGVSIHKSYRERLL